MGGVPMCEWCGEVKDTDTIEIHGKNVQLCWNCRKDWQERHEEGVNGEAARYVQKLA